MIFFLDQFSFIFFWQSFIRSNQAKLTKQQLGYLSRQNLIKKEMTMLLKNNQKVGKVASQQSKKKIKQKHSLLPTLTDYYMQN